MSRPINRWLLLSFALASVLPAIDTAAADKPADPAADKKEKKESARKYIRVVRDSKGQPLSMDTSIVRFAPKGADRAGLTVDLIGAVHVGEKSYYEALNKAFDEYDVLLYELVAPEDAKVPKKDSEGSGHPIAVIQTGMKNFLELEHQLNQVDYTKKNFVHADMTPEQFAKSMKDRGESMWSMMFAAMGRAMAMQKPGKSSETEMLFALFDKNRALAFKRIMAEQFEDDGLIDMLSGPDGSTIITERNKAALAVLTKQIAGGKKKIGIFYGAGHLADFEKRLDKEFELKMTEEKWLAAWNLKGKDEKKVEKK